MKTRPILDPRRIPSNFRFQHYIEEELAKAKQLLSDYSNDLNSNDLVNIALAFLEVTDKDNTKKYAIKALEIENKKPKPDSEVIATAQYALATMKREENDCDNALELFISAYNMTSSIWLKSNILRNIGLTYLKEKNFKEAQSYFVAALNCADNEGMDKLRGSLPALQNYVALATAKKLLNDDKTLPQDAQKLAMKIREVLDQFEEATKHYETIFHERNISEVDKQKSNDWQSHLFHRGMILCEIAELLAVRDDIFDATQIEKSLKLLLAAHEGRIANKADAQRLGDVCAWIGRVYILQGDVVKANEYLMKALKHYQTAFKNNPTAPQLIDVQERLNKLIPPKSEELENPFEDLKAPVIHGIFERPSSPLLMKMTTYQNTQASRKRSHSV